MRPLAVATSEPEYVLKPPTTSGNRCYLVATMLQWMAILVLFAWCTYQQVEIQKADGPVVQERLKTLEVSAQVTQQSLQINCNGNDSFTVLDSNGWAASRYCLLPNSANVTLPTEFIGSVVVGNTTEVDVVTNQSYYQFEGVSNLISQTPIFYISTLFDRLCGYYSTQTFPDNFVWCLTLSNLKCGKSNLVQARIETSPSMVATVDVELSFSIDACAVFAALP